MNKKIKRKQKEPRKIQEKQTKKKENIFVVFKLAKRQKRRKYVKHKTLFLFGFSFGKSFNDRDFAMVPLA